MLRTVKHNTAKHVYAVWNVYIMQITLHLLCVKYLLCINVHSFIMSTKDVMLFCLYAFSVCQQDNSESCGWIIMKFFSER